MAHLQYMPGDPRLVDQLVYELKSKGIFDQFRKDCIADVDTRPAYQNLRQRVENSVSTFLARQVWKPDLNKNQLREKLRKHILDGNYLEQGVERIVDQVVNPKVATVFVPKVEDLVYDYLGITRKKNAVEVSNGIIDLLPTDLEAVSPGSVKSNEEKDETMEMDEAPETSRMEVDEHNEKLVKENASELTDKVEDIETCGVSELTIQDSNGSDVKDSIPLPAEDIRPEDIPPPENSPPKIEKVEIDKIELPKEPDFAVDIPLPDEIPKQEYGSFFKTANSDDESSSDSSLRRNMSPLTPIRSYNNENSCDAQQAFENQMIENKKDEITEPSTFRFALDSKSTENSMDTSKTDKNEIDLPYQLNQVEFNTPAYEDSSNSHNLHIDYESDANSKINTEIKDERDYNSEDIRRGKKCEEKKSSHKSSYRSRDSQKHSSSRDKKSESKPSSSRDSSHHDKKSAKDDGKHRISEKERSRDKSNKKENKDSSRHRSSHKSSHRDSKSHSSSASHKRSSKSEDKKSSSSIQKDKETTRSDKSSDKSSSKEKYSKDSKSNSQHLHKDRDRKSSSSSKSRSNDKDKDKKFKKDSDDHYSLSGRGNPNRRSTDRDSNGSSSSKGSNRPPSSKSSESKKASKENTSKSDNTSGSGSTTPSDKEAPHDIGTKAGVLQNKPVIRIETHLEAPVASPPRLPFVPDIILKKPKIAANFEEAKKIMKMRKFLEEEQRRMNQEAALLLEFQANVRPSLSQVYSSIPGPELEFACNMNTAAQYITLNSTPDETHTYVEEKTYTNAELYDELNAGNETKLKDVKENEEKKTIIQTIEKDAISTQLMKSKSGSFEIERDLNINNVITNNSSEIETDEKKNKSNRIKTELLNKNEQTLIKNKEYKNKKSQSFKKNNLYYFAEYEKYNSDLEKTKYSNFLKSYIKKNNLCNKLYIINCDTYEENVLKDVASSFGDYEIVNYHRNGHLKMPKTKSIVKNVNLTVEVSLPIDLESRSNDSDMNCQVFSPGKSDYSFELSNDYNAKLEEMVNNTSRKEILEIILGDMIDSSLTNMPKIDYITESNIDSAIDCNLKRKMNDAETTENNNRPILTPHKTRRMSTSELITSTTQDTEEEEPSSNNKINNIRSKYLGRAKRVGLPRPKRTELPNSPSSDKSVENYEQNTLAKPSNGKVKTPRHIVQRYETSDLYKPKLHFLSRRNVS